MKKHIVFLLALALITVFAAGGAETLPAARAYLLTQAAAPKYGDEWLMCALSGDADSYFTSYEQALLSYARERDGVLSESKYTEYARVSLALLQNGRNPAAFHGYDFLKPLTDYEKVTRQGITAVAYALMALYGAEYADAEDVTVRYLVYLLGRQHEDGSFSFIGEKGDADCTAIVIRAIAPYPGAREAANRALNALSEMQLPGGGFITMGEENCESAAQALLALRSLKITPDDERFVKDGKTLVDVICAYQREGGGFAHTQDGDVSILAGIQAYAALKGLEF